MEGLEARLATLREGIVDIHTAEGALERAQVSGASRVNFLQNFKTLNLYCKEYTYPTKRTDKHELLGGCHAK